MKRLNFKNTIVVSFLVFLFLTGCYEFNFVNQPYTADPNSSFEVQISVIKETSSDSMVFFGVLLPIGWTIADSILYTNDITNETAYVVYSDTLSQQMSIIDPPGQNYYWWVGGSFAGGNYNETFYTDFKIYTDKVRNRFNVSDYALKLMWRHLPYKRRLPFIEQAHKETKDMPFLLRKDRVVFFLVS